MTRVKHQNTPNYINIHQNTQHTQYTPTYTKCTKYNKIHQNTKIHKHTQKYTKIPNIHKIHQNTPKHTKIHNIKSSNSSQILNFLGNPQIPHVSVDSSKILKSLQSNQIPQNLKYTTYIRIHKIYNIPQNTQNT